MASVNPTSSAAQVERDAAQRRTGRGIVVLLWILVMVPLLWGVMMTLKDVRNFFQ